MPVSADLFCRVNAFGSDPLALLVQVQNNVTDPDGLRLDAEIDGTAGAMAVPVTLTKQSISMRVYVDGVLVPELHACRVTRSRDKNIQDGEFTVPIQPGGTGYAGDFLGRGSNLRKKRIDVFGVYLTSTGYHEVPLIANGICNDDGREQSDGAKITFRFVDGGGRFDQVLTDLVIPPGSGLSRDRVVKIAATRAGVERISLERSGTTMNHEFQMADGNFIPACQEMADVEGRVIQWDRSDYMIWRQYGSPNILRSRPVWSFTERNFVKGTCKLSQPGELVTEITVEGDEQILSGPCGDVTSRVTITTRSLNGPVAPLYAQSTGSSYAANPQPDALVAPIPVRVETFDTTRRCGIVVYERRTVQEYFNPEVDRYDWDAASDAWLTLGNVYTDDNTDDDSPAYLYPSEQWLITEIDETWHYWFRDGFEGPTAFNLTGQFPGFSLLLIDLGYGLSAPKGWEGIGDPDGSRPAQWDGLKIGTLNRQQRWYGVREAVKTRTVTSYPYDIWEEVEPADNTRVLGNKEAVVNGAEEFQETAVQFNILGSDGRGYQTDDDEYRFAYLARSGPEFRYGDETEHAENVETIQYTGATLTHYIGNGSENHDEVETERDLNDRTIRTVASTGLESYLPAADRIPDSGPSTDTDIYEDDAELADLYNRAYRTETRPISVTVTDDELEANSTRGVHKVHSQYVENEEEADWLARWLLEEGAAGVFDGDLAGANFFVEPGDECATVRYRKIGLAGMPGRVDSVTWNWTAGETLNTGVTILIYPVT